VTRHGTSFIRRARVASVRIFFSIGTTSAQALALVCDTSTGTPHRLRGGSFGSKTYLREVRCCCLSHSTVLNLDLDLCTHQSQMPSTARETERPDPDLWLAKWSQQSMISNARRAAVSCGWRIYFDARSPAASLRLSRTDQCWWHARETKRRGLDSRRASHRVVETHRSRTRSRRGFVSRIQ